MTSFRAVRLTGGFPLFGAPRVPLALRLSAVRVVRGICGTRLVRHPGSPGSGTRWHPALRAHELPRAEGLFPAILSCHHFTAAGWTITTADRRSRKLLRIST